MNRLSLRALRAFWAGFWFAVGMGAALGCVMGVIAIARDLGTALEWLRALGKAP